MKNIIEIVNGFMYEICMYVVFARKYAHNVNNPATPTYEYCRTVTTAAIPRKH